jgi:D-alanine-D-alanine ligase
MSKRTVLFLCGGSSEEHEISLISAHCVLQALDRSRWEPLVVGIDKRGRWGLAANADFFTGSVRADQIRLREDLEPAAIDPSPQPDSRGRLRVGARTLEFDVVFPMLHGTFGEDGRIQGLLEVARLPFVGSGCGSSWNCMDKVVTKTLAAAAGIPVVPFAVATPMTSAAELETFGKRLGFPIFVKPARQGSSVGVSKVHTAGDLPRAVAEALRHDSKVLLETGVVAREIECAVLGRAASARVAPPGEIVPNRKIGWYSYEAKYLLDDGAETLAPAPLRPEEAKEAQKWALEAFRVLECDGLARVDLFLERHSGRYYLNEINTLPGFTPISMYPKMWATAGLAYADLVSELLELAMTRPR